jgi:hypothetical protein
VAVASDPVSDLGGELENSYKTVFGAFNYGDRSITGDQVPWKSLVGGALPDMVAGLEVDVVLRFELHAWDLGAPLDKFSNATVYGLVYEKE